MRLEGGAVGKKSEVTVSEGVTDRQDVLKLIQNK
jgi:hypothetical protein